MIVTKHATRRIRSRVGIAKGGAERVAGRALEKGISHGETSGVLHGYMTRLFFKYKTATNLRIWCNYVYVFCDETLVTVFQLPPELRKQAEKIGNRKSGKRKVGRRRETEV